MKRSGSGGSRAPLHVGEEVGSLDELHGEKERARFWLNELVKAHQVPVVDVCERPELLLEQIDQFGSTRSRVFKATVRWVSRSSAS